jgi:hypothetical protein
MSQRALRARRTIRPEGEDGDCDGEAPERWSDDNTQVRTTVVQYRTVALPPFTLTSACVIQRDKTRIVAATLDNKEPGRAIGVSGALGGRVTRCGDRRHLRTAACLPAESVREYRGPHVCRDRRPHGMHAASGRPGRCRMVGKRPVGSHNGSSVAIVDAGAPDRHSEHRGAHRELRAAARLTGPAPRLATRGYWPDTVSK